MQISGVPRPRIAKSLYDTLKAPISHNVQIVILHQTEFKTANHQKTKPVYNGTFL